MSEQTRTRIGIRVNPGAAANAITGWMGDQLKIRVTAVPEKGKANQAVIKLLSQTLGLPADAFRISKGGTSSNKIIEVSGISEDEIHRRLKMGDRHATPN